MGTVLSSLRAVTPRLAAAGAWLGTAAARLGRLRVPLLACLLFTINRHYVSPWWTVMQAVASVLLATWLDTFIRALRIRAWDALHGGQVHVLHHDPRPGEDP